MLSINEVDFEMPWKESTQKPLVFSPVGKITMIFLNTGAKTRLFSVFRLIFSNDDHKSCALKNCAKTHCIAQYKVKLYVFYFLLEAFLAVARGFAARLRVVPLEMFDSSATISRHCSSVRVEASMPLGIFTFCFL